jgi:archaellum component FlaG (FlaF/FlaG flagellin family)
MRLGTFIGAAVSSILAASFAATVTSIAAANANSANNATTDDAWLLLNAFAIANASYLWWNQFDFRYVLYVTNVMMGSAPTVVVFLQSGLSLSFSSIKTIPVV